MPAAEVTSVYSIAPDGRHIAYSASDGVHIVFELGLHTARPFSIAGSVARHEVYLSMLEWELMLYGCGSSVLVVYDGITLRRF